MGGHGGLNILPQKRWNVYNYSNRQQVEKDRSKVAMRQKKKEDEEQKSVGQLRLDILKKKQEKNDRYEQKNTIIEQKPNALTKEFAEIISQKPQNFNLFSEEQKYNETKDESLARIEKKQKSKEQSEEPKYFDSSNKFLGNYRENTAKTWYLKHSGEEIIEENNWIVQKRKLREKKKENLLESGIKEFWNQKEQCYKVLQCEGEKKEKDNVQQIVQQTLEEQLKRKKEKKKLRKIERKLRKKEKKRLKKLACGEDGAKEKEKRKKLRIERLEREQSEKQREQDLIRKKFPFEFQY